MQLLVALLVAAVTWAVLGYLATAPLGAIYGWSGHPAIPAASWSIYVAVYFITLPLICLIGAWFVAGRMIALVRR
jgi:hypothetical protein